MKKNTTINPAQHLLQTKNDTHVDNKSVEYAELVIGLPRTEHR